MSSISSFHIIISTLSFYRSNQLEPSQTKNAIVDFNDSDKEEDNESIRDEVWNI